MNGHAILQSCEGVQGFVPDKRNEMGLRFVLVYTFASIIFIL